ncbi:MAG: hypothetical protein PHV28_15730 [Kiritimatiellae bacterium]|nr:hypothetical protein [Kiritimatiellia bacterium]
MNLTSKRMLQCFTAVAGVFAFTATAGQTWWGVKDAFENADGGTNGMVIADYKATAVGDGTTNYLWLAAETDASKIVTNDSDRASYSGINPITDPAANDLVLELATEGNTLTRHVMNGTSTGRTFEASSVYVDTLIKFTPSEDTPSISNDVKVAVYVNVNSNLVVYHGPESGDPVHSVFDDIFISPNTWNRLTIKLGYVDPISFCNIYLNGVALTHTNAVGENQDVFLTAVGGNVLNAVAFQGTGFVDELVVSDDADLGAGAAILLTLSYDTGIEMVTTNGAAVANNGTVPNGALIVIDAKDWYAVTGVNGATFADPGLTEPANVVSGTVTAAASTNVTITSAKYTGSMELGGKPVDLDKLSTWALAQQPALTEAQVAANADGWYDEYLLNLAPDAAVTNTIAIDSIAVGATDATIKVVASSTDVNFASINGTLKIYAATNLVTGFGGEPVALEPVAFTSANNTNTVVVPISAGSFIKAKVE